MNKPLPHGGSRAADLPFESDLARDDAEYEL